MSAAEREKCETCDTVVRPYSSLLGMRSGHDPASPHAEMFINYHETGWAIMIFIMFTTIASFKK